MRYDLKLLPFQADLIRSKAKYTLLRGGLGAGKTWAVCLYAVTRAIQYPGSIGVIAANSYKQLHSATMATAFQILDDMGIRYRHNKLEQRVYLENGSVWALYSLENYNDLRGIEISYAICDELSFSSLAAWNVLCARVRKKGFGPLEIRASSTPNGFNFMYDIFVGEAKTHYHEEIYADPALNRHLPEGYLESLKSSYDPLTYQQEVLGLYVASTSGKKYYAFDRSIHVRDFGLAKLANIPASAGNDFNVSPITSVIGWLINGSYRIGSEIHKLNSNTFELADMLQKHPLNVELCYPDAAGKQQKSSSIYTDHEILRQAGFELRTRSKNPPIKDRVNTLNWLFSQNRITIHPGCEKLIEDMESESWDTKDLSLGHLADGLGYWAYYETPLRPLRELKQRSF